jgi:predicted ATP-grasp superfamily ATP-dependent carboligase
MPASRQKPYALVVGLDSMNGIQTARLLHDRGVPVIAFARDPGHYCCRTHVCEKILYADTRSEAVINTLARLGPSLGQKAVVFPCDDMSVLQVSQHREKLQDWYHVVLPPVDVVELMMNKLQFYSFAMEQGLSIPPTRFVTCRTDAAKAAAEMSFPCIVKPPISSVPRWEMQSKRKAYRVTNGEELLFLYDKLSVLADVLIVQEWIPGPESNLYSCNCYLDDRSEVLVTFVARKLRQWPPETGESCLGEECRNDAVLHETVRLFKSVRHRGLGYLEMKQDSRSGEHFIIEPNIGRPTGRSAIAEAGGVELLYTMYCDALGWPLPESLEQQYRGVKWIYLRRDLQSSLHYWQRGELSLQDWWKSLRGHKAYAMFSWHDPGPFLFDWLRAIRLYASREERRKRDFRHSPSYHRQA